MRNFAIKKSNMTEREKMERGMLYQANHTQELLDELHQCEEKCFEINQLHPSQRAKREELLRQLLGKTGEGLTIIAPFFCDYGRNISVGDHFFANTRLVILDEAPVTFGNNVFIGPNCSFYTACHPLDEAQRNEGLEFCKPIHVGNSVWLGGNVTVLAGVTIGNNVVVGAGSVVTRDIPDNSVAVGNPARVIKKLSPAAQPKSQEQA